GRSAEGRVVGTGCCVARRCGVVSYGCRLLRKLVPSAECWVRRAGWGVLRTECCVATPKGLCRPAQGCRPRLPWVDRKQPPQPCRGCVATRETVLAYPITQPLQGCYRSLRSTQGSGGRQPWAGRRNPFGVVTQHQHPASALSTQHSALSPEHSGLSKAGEGFATRKGVA